MSALTSVSDQWAWGLATILKIVKILNCSYLDQLVYPIKVFNSKPIKFQSNRLILRTTTEQRYQSILNTMDQIVVEADDLALQFEKQLREKVCFCHFQ